VEEEDRWEVIALGSREFPYVEHPDAFFMERMAKHYFFVAEVDGAFAGFIDMEPVGTEDALIAGFAVRQELRGRGVGRALFDFALRFLKAVGFKKAIIYSKKDNHIANKIYRKFGFNAVSENNGIVKWMRAL